MPNLKPYTGDTELVIAFDIGTTFSGVSYCILEQGQVPEIHGVTRFPGQATLGGDAKVPSILYYDKDGILKAAGAEALVESVIEYALIEEWIKAEWWKLHLRPEHLASFINKDDDLPPLPPGKSAVHVLADFMGYLFQCVKTFIAEHHLTLLWSSIEQSTQYIFTYPNGWEGAQQQMYRRAVELAGLIPPTPEGRLRVHMLTEGEASLYFCVANLLNSDTTNQTAPHGIVIIDAGGATVDLSMFSVNFGPISCEEIAPAECRLQGSVFVTRRAKELLERKLEGWEHSSPEEICEYTREFDQSTKLVIKSDQEPAYIKVGGRRTNVPKYDIRFGKLKLTGEEATGLFTESIDAIISTFEQQQISAAMPIEMAFVVGGLSASDWLWSRLQAYFKAKKINVCRPDNHINKAVANGAVLSHVDRDNHLVASRVARVTYGVVCAVPVTTDDEEHIRRKDQWESDPTGECYIPDHFEAKIYKGDQADEEMIFRDSFLLTESELGNFDTQIIRFVCYRGRLAKLDWVDQDPSSFSTLCTIHVHLSEAAKDLVPQKEASGQIYYQLDYDVIVHFSLTELQAELCWMSKEGERRIPATVSFDSPDFHLKDEKNASDPRQPRKVVWDSTSVSRRLELMVKELGRRSSEELQTNAALIEEKDRSIAALTVENARLQQLDIEKTKLIATVPRDLRPYVQYGVVCSLPVDADDEEHLRRKDLWEIDPRGDSYVPGYFESKLRMGTDARKRMEFRDSFSLIINDPADFGVQSVRILCYQGNLSNPKWVDEDEASFSEFCTIHVDLSEAVKDLVMKKDDSGEVYYQLDYDVIVSFGSVDVHAELCWTTREGERRVPATISYED